MGAFGIILSSLVAFPRSNMEILETVAGFYREGVRCGWHWAPGLVPHAWDMLVIRSYHQHLYRSNIEDLTRQIKT